MKTWFACFSRLLAAAALAAAAQSQAQPLPVLDIQQTADIAAGRAAMGPTRTLFDWTRSFAPDTLWSPGDHAPGLNGPAGIVHPDGSFVMAGPNLSLHLANWLDGAGFDRADGSATPDLAINGAETFTLSFAAPLTTLGFAISTGLSNLPSEVDHLGAVFDVTTETGAQGVLTLADPGAGYAAWVRFSSPTPFQTLTLTERGGAAADQYFGNVLTPVPEPGAAVLWALGLAGLAGWCRRRAPGGPRGSVAKTACLAKHRD